MLLQLLDVMLLQPTTGSPAVRAPPLTITAGASHLTTTAGEPPLTITAGASPLTITAGASHLTTTAGAPHTTIAGASTYRLLQENQNMCTRDKDIVIQSC